MERNKVDERWWLYKVTEEQINKINVGDVEEIRRFWEDNEKLIVNLIKGELFCQYVYTGKHIDLEDCISQVYCDLSKYRIVNSRDITHGIFKSVKYCVRGYKSGRAYYNEISLNDSLKEDFTLEDILVGASDVEECIDFSVESERLFYKVASLLFPTSEKKQKSFLSRL